jgi:uncharacterized protein YjbJ (UPF0337 family)
MNTQEVSRANWNRIVGKAKEKWGQLTDDEVTETKGDLQQLAGLIEQKTGEARDKIEQFFDDVVNGRRTEVEGAVRHYAREAQHRMQDAGQYVTDAARSGYRQTERAISTHPVESTAIAFAAGLGVGLVLGLSLWAAMREPEPPTYSERASRQLHDLLARIAPQRWRGDA